MTEFERVWCKPCNVVWIISSYEDLDRGWMTCSFCRGLLSVHHDHCHGDDPSAQLSLPF